MESGRAKNARYIRLEASSSRIRTTKQYFLGIMGAVAEVRKSDEEWRRELTPEQYRVLREQGTEPPFSHEYALSKEKGVYRCAGCGAELFRSDTKFDSGTGWPSFTEPGVAGAVELRPDA